MRFWLFPLALVCLLSSTVALAATDREVYIYRGEPISQLGVKVDSWGSGKAVESGEKALIGNKSIKITTQSLYAGARIDFPQPVVLFSDGIDPKRYVLFTFFFEDLKTVDPAQGSPYAYDTEPYQIPKVGVVRFVFVSDAGVKVSAEQVTNPLDPDDNWVRIAVPLAKLKLPEGMNEFRLKRLLISSDLPNTFYLGEIKLVTDNTPIKVESLQSQTVVVSVDEVLFAPRVEGGVSSLKFAWDFDASNGIQPESTERVGRFIYTKGGEYTVTLTVSDVDGLKDPVTVKTTVTVTD